MQGVDRVLDFRALGHENGGAAVRTAADGEGGVADCFARVERDGGVEAEDFTCQWEGETMGEGCAPSLRTWRR